MNKKFFAIILLISKINFAADLSESVADLGDLGKSFVSVEEDRAFADRGMNTEASVIDKEALEKTLMHLRSQLDELKAEMQRSLPLEQVSLVLSREGEGSKESSDPLTQLTQQIQEIQALFRVYANQTSGLRQQILALQSQLSHLQSQQQVKPEQPKKEEPKKKSRFNLNLDCFCCNKK